MSVDWNMVSAIGQVSSAAIALVGLGFIGWQIKEGRKTADLQSLQVFLQTATDHERRMIDAETQDRKDEAFFEFLNFLEIHASAVNGGLFPKVSRMIVVEKLRDSIAMIEAFSDWHEKFQRAVLTPSTFISLQKFMQKERKEIAKLRALRLNP
ncbi:hypothetical protein [Methylobacterium tarhaniae]|uniref:hypothetical protein n=1 Tax=Methylobacterium tarhaniae TaxID=1187852 RepID=UPI003D079EED